MNRLLFIQRGSFFDSSPQDPPALPPVPALRKIWEQQMKREFSPQELPRMEQGLLRLSLLHEEGWQLAREFFADVEETLTTDRIFTLTIRMYLPVLLSGGDQILEYTSGMLLRCLSVSETIEIFPSSEEGLEFRFSFPLFDEIF